MDLVAQSTLTALALFDGARPSRSYENALRQACGLEEPVFSSRGFVQAFIEATTSAETLTGFLMRYVEGVEAAAQTFAELCWPLARLVDQGLLLFHAADGLRQARCARSLFCLVARNGTVPEVELKASVRWRDGNDSMGINSEESQLESGLDRLARVHMDQILGRSSLLLIREGIFRRPGTERGSPMKEGLEYVNADGVRGIAFTRDIVDRAIAQGYGNLVRQRMAASLGTLNFEIRRLTQMPETSTAISTVP